MFVAAWRSAPALAAAGGSAAFQLGNLFAHPLADADVIMIYGLQPVMARVAAKLDAEAKPGAVVLAYRAKLPEQGSWHLHGSIEDVHVYCRADSPLR